MTRAELTTLVPAVVAIAAKASAAILAVYESPDALTVDHKTDDSPLTAADLASHRVIVDALAALTPDIPVLSEESTGLSFSERSGWDRFWLVDPLDGTKEFIKRNGEFTVNIALVEDHRPVLGVVVVPVTGIAYWGVVGAGAAKASLSAVGPLAAVDGADAVAAGAPICVASNSASPPRVVGSRSHAGPRVEAFLAALGDHQLVSIGSSIKLCLVAEGAADVYPRLGPTCEWDTAAAQAVVEAAGGVVVDPDGKPLRCNTGESMLNPEFVVVGPTDIDWLAFVPADEPLDRT